MEVNKTNEKIIKILKENGPSLPIRLSKEIGMSSLFISAFLSGLVDDKRIKISNLKVGGSPLYFLDGQEEKLESFYKYLHPKEAEAFLLLKKNKILKDSVQAPAIRVALRSIRDFAIGFKKDEEIYWRYMLIPKEEAENISEPKIESKKIKKKILPIKVKENYEFQNQLVIKPLKQKKQKTKSEFVSKVINFINNNSLKIIEEKEYKVREYNCIIEIRSELGIIRFMTLAKDKKTISEADFKKLLSKAQSVSLPAFMIYTGEISKKAKEFLKKYSSILKAKKLD